MGAYTHISRKCYMGIKKIKATDVCQSPFRYITI